MSPRSTLEDLTVERNDELRSLVAHRDLLLLQFGYDHSSDAKIKQDQADRECMDSTGGYSQEQEDCFDF